ncbi:TolC family protein [Solimicrobium silvestre]|uniref:Outer membrane efflux protein n=1 Tax=Solimicrobium silvestre TaxID=2099400 RepID=A0A2S9H5D8_9BURK|nr:TolC family protein [Solimicrobium silvestre]PRC95086.1 Outer membrane efflux protein [Solimicrobium silvestre]
MKKINSSARRYRRLWAALAVLPMLNSPAVAETAPPAAFTGTDILFKHYLDAVEQHNSDLAAERENIVSAEAGVSIAGVRPDPELTFGIDSYELYKPQKPNASTATTASIAFTIETAGKRGKRINAARSNVKLAQVTVEGFKHELYLQATEAFTEACRSQQALLRQEATLKSLSDVVKINAIRRKAGDVSGLELSQSRVERDQFEAEVISARADAEAALLNLSIPLGKHLSAQFGDAPLSCEFSRFETTDEPSQLIRQALTARDEMLIAQATLDHARDNATLERANRYIDPVINLGITNTPPVHPIFNDEGEASNDVAGRSRTLGLTVTIPIPFSHMQRGELAQAESTVTQAMLGLRSAHLKTEIAVSSAFAQFQAKRENVRRYQESVLLDSDQVLEGIRLSYRKGAASLLELLDAQRSADDAYLSFLQAQADLTIATVQLQLAIGQRPTL